MTNFVMQIGGRALKAAGTREIKKAARDFRAAVAVSKDADRDTTRQRALMTSRIARHSQSKTKCADAQFTDFAREKSNAHIFP